MEVLFVATTIMQNFVALPNQLNKEIWPQETKNCPERIMFFKFIDLKTLFKGQSSLIFFPFLLF